MALRNRLWRVIPYTFTTIRHVLVFLIARWLLRYVLVIFWKAPSELWGWWVVFGAYGLLFGFVAVYFHLLALDRWLAYGLVWVFLARWRWNLAKFKHNVRPLFERRDDV